MRARLAISRPYISRPPITDKRINSRLPRSNAASTIGSRLSLVDTGTDNHGAYNHRWSRPRCGNNHGYNSRKIDARIYGGRRRWADRHRRGASRWHGAYDREPVTGRRSTRIVIGRVAINRPIAASHWYLMA